MFSCILAEFCSATCAKRLRLKVPLVSQMKYDVDDECMVSQTSSALASDVWHACFAWFLCTCIL